MEIVKSSFRDPSGSLFFEDGVLYRKINKSYQENYEYFRSCGLYDDLIKRNLIIPHIEESPELAEKYNCYKIIRPEILPYVSYPYEWSFQQYKDCALLTLYLQKLALKYNMTLKDASAYNAQFYKGRPVLIDTLSFEKYNEGSPWIAYKQFCQHFLAPLSLSAYTDIRLTGLMKNYIDGIPLDLTSKLLPSKTKLKMPLLMHIHIHSKYQKKYSSKTVESKKIRMSRTSLAALIDNLISIIKKLNWKYTDTEWGDYYNNTNYSDTAFETKKTMVSEYLTKCSSKFVWDIGANSGEFSRLADSMGADVISFDIDPVAVNENYLKVKKAKEKLLPLLLDVTNPSPSIGWNNDERLSFKERNTPDTIMALALIHHLAISNNLPLSKISDFFAAICHNLIIEFVPKTDSQVERLLATREDIFPDYNLEGFEKEFNEHFIIVEKKQIKGSERTLYLLKNRK